MDGNPLMNVPGLAGYLAQQQMGRQNRQQDMDVQVNQLKLVEMIRTRQQEEQDAQQLKSVMTQTGGDPTKAIQALMTAGTPKSIELASKLKGLVPKDESSTTLDRLVAKRAELAKTNPNDPNLHIYDNAIRKESETAKQISPTINMPQPITTISVMEDDPKSKYFGKPVLKDGRTGRTLGLDSRLDVGAQGAKASAVAAAGAEGKAIGEQRGLLPNQNEALVSVKSAQKLLSEGIYSGGYSKLKMAAAKYTPGVDTDKAARTEQFISHIGNTVVPRLKEFGGSDTVEEMNYLREIMGGNISLEAGALKAILDQVEAKIQRGIDRLNQGMDVNGNPTGNNNVDVSNPLLR